MHSILFDVNGIVNFSYSFLVYRNATDPYVLVSCKSTKFTYSNSFFQSSLQGFLYITQENLFCFLFKLNLLTSFLILFPYSIDKISKITSPVLIIHGTEDEVIDFSHGLALFERCQRPVEPLWVEGAGHNDVELYGQYLERLKQFVSQELVNL